MVSTILFDLDDTLLDFKKSERVALKATLQQLGLDPCEEILTRYHDINRQQWERLELGEITREQVLRLRFSLLFEEYGIDKTAEMAKVTYEKLLGEQVFFVSDAVNILRALSQEYTLYLITNGTSHIQRRRLENAGILPYFADIFISHEIGFNKPDPRYFEYCFEHIPSFEKEKTVIIGDSLSSDIKGGNSVGVRTCWFNPSHQIANHEIAKPNYEFEALTHLPQLLAKL